MARLANYASIIVSCAVFSARAHADVPSAPALTDEQQVIATETEWVQAEVQRDAAVLERVLDDRFMVNSSTGKLSDKTTVIADVLSWKMTSQTITDRTVVVDGNTAIVYGTANLRFAAEGEDDEVWAGRYTTTYIRRDGRWRALALQMTELKAK